METRHLRTFAAASELRSFTKAARSLSLTQAAVSQHVAALEKELRVSLFERSGRSVALTDAGRRLYDYARKILDLMDTARRDVGQTTASVNGSLRIAASTVPAEVLLPDLLKQFHEQYPDVTESVQISDSSGATGAVERGEADLGFVGELPRAGRLKVRPLAHDELVIIVCADHVWAAKKRIGIEQLRTEPLIFREPGSGSRRCVEQALEAAGLAPSELNVVLQMNSNDAIRRAVSRGIGVAFMSRALVEDETQNGTLHTLGVRGVRPQRQLYLLVDPDRIPTPPARALLNFLDTWPSSVPADR